ncbi:DUF6350 family protein [Streptomyces microflavus]
MDGGRPAARAAAVLVAPGAPGGPRADPLPQPGRGRVPGGGGGAAVLSGGGALLVAVALGRNAAAAQESFLMLSGDWSGRFAVLLLGAALVPNAALWGAAYGLGPGFALGTGATATRSASPGPRPCRTSRCWRRYRPRPGRPAELGGPRGAGRGRAGGRMVHRTQGGPADAPRAQAWSPRETVLVTGLAALGCGAGTALLTAVAGGPLGSGALSAFGPVWWLTGPAALVWTAAVGVPAALLLRVWRLREPGWAWRRDLPAEEAGEKAAEPAVGKPVPAPEKKANEAEEEATDRPPRRWWAPWRKGGPGEGAAQAGPAPAASAEESAPAGGAATDDAGFEPYDFLPTDPWHEKEVREARWASLKQSSGGLMADFPARVPAAPRAEEPPAEAADRKGREDGGPTP